VINLSQFTVAGKSYLVDKQEVGLLGNEVPFLSFAFREIAEAVFVGSKDVQLMTICV